MAKKSRDKGARYEREIAHRYRDAGFTDAYRTAQFCGNTGHAADVEDVPASGAAKALRLDRTGGTRRGRIRENSGRTPPQEPPRITCNLAA